MTLLSGNLVLLITANKQRVMYRASFVVNIEQTGTIASSTHCRVFLYAHPCRLVLANNFNIVRAMRLVNVCCDLVKSVLLGHDLVIAACP